jgi:peptidoglycan/LPS O-acetylase OafA/YrhL
LLRERDRNGVIDLKAFYIRRSLRIFPLYYGVLALYVVVVALLERNTAVGQAFFGNLIYFATYTSNLFVPLDGRVIFYFAWSLAAEEQFYLIWPTVVFLAGSALRASIPLALVFTVCIAGHLLGNKFLSAVPIAIIAGALIAILLHTKRGYALLEMILGKAWSSVAVIMVLVVSLASEAVPGFVVHILFATLVGSCVCNERHLLAPMLSIKLVAYIGSISYGMYMLHMLCKNAVVKLLGVFALPANGVEVFVLTLLVSVAAASLSFRYFESFFLRIKSGHER